MSEEREHEFAGLAFVACMFIGAGIGLAFDRPDVGWMYRYRHRISRNGYYSHQES